jgi:hypothetical protein
MKKILTGLVVVLALSGCATVETVKKYWPRAHDPAMFGNLVELTLAISNVNCEQPDWASAQALARQLATYTEWRRDPQADNIKGLYNHTERMGRGGSKAFCELGKKTAQQRIMAAKSAWETR